MDPAILFGVATLGVVCGGVYVARARYLSNLPLQISRQAIRKERGPETFLLFRVRLGRGRCAESPRAELCVRSRAGTEIARLKVHGPSERVVGPWTFRVPVALGRWGPGVTVEADVHAREGERGWSAQQVWTAGDIKTGSFRSLRDVVARSGVIDRPHWEDIQCFSADHALAKAPDSGIL